MHASIWESMSDNKKKYEFIQIFVNKYIFRIWFFFSIESKEFCTSLHSQQHQNVYRRRKSGCVFFWHTHLTLVLNLKFSFSKTDCQPIPESSFYPTVQHWLLKNTFRFPLTHSPSLSPVNITFSKPPFFISTLCLWG